MSTTKDAVKILRKLAGESEEVRAGIAYARFSFEVAQMIYDARTRSGLSQRELAALVDTKPSVITRLEDADYEGHSLTMLRRIAAALDQRLEMRFVPGRGRATRGGQARGTLQPA